MTTQQRGRGTTPADQEYMTTAEVAALVRVPVATVRYWRHLGKGPASIKPGRHVLYPAAEVRAWLKRLADEEAA